MRFVMMFVFGLFATGCQMLYADNPDYDTLAQPITADEGGLLADG